MYHAQYKQKYLNTIKDKLLHNKLQNMFEELSSIEEELGTDICDMDPASYPGLIMKSSKTKLRFHRVYELFIKMMEYRNYCEIYGFTTDGVADRWTGHRYTIDEIYELYHAFQHDDMKELAVTFDEPTLWARIFQLYPDLRFTIADMSAELTLNEVAAMFIMFILYGIKVEDIKDLKRDQFVISGASSSCLKYNGREISMSDRMTRLIRKSFISQNIIDGRGKNARKLLLKNYLITFDAPDLFERRIRGKIRIDKHNKQIQIPDFREIYFNSCVRIIVEENQGKEFGDKTELLNEFKRITGIDSRKVLSATKTKEIITMYEKIKKYYE